MPDPPDVQGNAGLLVIEGQTVADSGHWDGNDDP